MNRRQADEKQNQQDREKRGEKFEQRQIQWAMGTEGVSRGNLFTSAKAVKEIVKDQPAAESGHRGTGMRIRTGDPACHRHRRDLACSRAHARYRF